MKQILLTTVLSLSFATATVAQEKLWTLDECMRYAVENSPSVKKQVYTSDTYKAERNAAVASFSRRHRLRSERNIVLAVRLTLRPIPMRILLRLIITMASTLLFLFYGRTADQSMVDGKSNRRMGVNDIQKAKDDLAMKAMQAYMDVVYYKGTIRMAAEKLEESNRTLYKTRRQEELGLKGKADVAQFEAQVAADDYTLTLQQNLFNTALLTLRECMNYPSDLELEVDTLLPDINYVPEVENVAEIFAYASGNNPTALQAEYQLTQSKYQYRIYKGKLLPSIYLNAGISTSYFENLKSDNAPEVFKDQFKNNRGEYVSFSLSFPLFDGLSRLTNARRYRNNMRIARETRTEVFRQLQTAIEQSVLDREGYAKEAIQMDKKVRSDELAYRVTLRKYEEGLMSTLDVQTSANTLLESKANLLQKRLMYLLKSKLVDYYKGKPLINE